MDIRWSRRRVGLGVLAAACLVALAASLGRWQRREPLDEGMSLVAEEHYLPAARVLLRAVALAPHEDDTEPEALRRTEDRRGTRRVCSFAASVNHHIARENEDPMRRP